MFHRSVRGELLDSGIERVAKTGERQLVDSFRWTLDLPAAIRNAVAYLSRAMRRYFFHTEEDWALEPVELPDDAAAREYAMRAARQLLAEAVLEGRLALHEKIIAHAEDGEHLFTITLGEAVGQPPPDSQ